MIRKLALRSCLCIAVLGALPGAPARGQDAAPAALSRVPASLLPGNAGADVTRTSGLPGGMADPIRAPFAARVPAQARDARAAVAKPAGPPSVPAGPGLAAPANDEVEAPSARPAAGGRGADMRDGRPESGPGGLASTSAPERYQVGPGDVLRVTVWQEPDASGDFKVSAQGTIQHFLLGQVGVSGHTAAEISEVLRSALAAGFLRDPKVDVRVEEYHAQQAFVYGQVARPGTYELRGETDVLKILLDAGGPTHLAGDGVTLLHVTKSAKGEEVQSRTISLEKLLARGDLSQNAPVESGDVIFVPGKEESARAGAAPDGRAFYVLGEVKNPGSYRFRDGATAMTAILEAGGFNEFARPNKTKLVRERGAGRDTKILKMGEVMEKGDRSMDVKLEPGDVLVVPKSLF